MSRNVQLATLAAVALVFGGGGFVAGMTLAPAATPAAANPEIAAALAQRRAGGPLPGGAVQTGQIGGQVAGEVISVADGSLTIETTRPGGDSAQSVIALVGGSTKIVRTTETEISLGDIKAGDQVIVVGQRDATSGAVSASTVVVGLSSLRPAR